jgi:TolB-like protein
MATVYLATDKRHDRQVAIKVLHPDLASTIGSERFEREIKLAAKLQHPHILGLIDSGTENGLFYYVMPFIEGESVRDKLDRETQLSVDEALQITLEVADALGYAHAQNIVHRDIKPENVMMSNGHALVADFGIARARNEAGQSKLTQTGMALGTPVYMSPEQATGEAVGPPADIYSLGCMLYEMLAGEPPFTGPNAMAIMAKHAMEMVPSVRITRPSVPEEVEEAILAAMEKSVADRPKTAADFCEILGTPLGATATRRITGRHTARHRVPTGARLPAFTTAEAEAKLGRIPLWKRPMVLVGGTAATLALVAGVWAAVTGPLASAAISTDVDDRRVAVRYFTVEGSYPTLQPVGDRLTESLIRELSSIRTLKVISRNGVTPFRDPDISRDSVARALQVGTMVEGTIEPEGTSRVRVTVRLYDRTGTNLGDPRSVVVARDSLFQAEESVALTVASELRDRLGDQIQLAETRAGTRSNAAWTLLNRAEGARREGLRFGPANPDSAQLRLDAADSLLRLAATTDRDWMEPRLNLIQVAYDRFRVLRGDERKRWLDSALARADAALGSDGGNAQALAWRGTVRYAQSRPDLAPDDATRQRLLESARDDLEQAAQRDPNLVSAYATLTFLYYDMKDVPTSLSRARLAWENDEFLSNTEAILDRLFWGSYDTELFADAKKYCGLGYQRFPRSVRFTLCSLWLQLWRDETPDVAAAWRLSARVDSLARGGSESLESHLARMLVGGIIGREAKAAAEGPRQTALLDSARKVLVSARGDREVDPTQELPGYEAIMRIQLGDIDEALTLLSRYVAVNPSHSFQVGGNTHWWWRDIRNHPRFVALTKHAP